MVRSFFSFTCNGRGTHQGQHCGCNHRRRCRLTSERDTQRISAYPATCRAGVGKTVPLLDKSHTHTTRHAPLPGVRGVRTPEIVRRVQLPSARALTNRRLGHLAFLVHRPSIVFSPVRSAWITFARAPRLSPWLLFSLSAPAITDAKVKLFRVTVF